MAMAMREHDDTLRSTIDEAGGVVFKHTGDGMISAFASPRAAVRAAVTAQERLGLPVRMGLHTGEAELRDQDYFGTSLNRAARVMDAGHGGQILLSAVTESLLDAEVATTDLGLFELKGLEGAERVFQVGDGSFPELRARRAQEGNIPRDLTEFVGRTDELEQLAAEIETSPVVTLFGVGGTGKTRLAVELARSAASTFADGCWLVELGPVDVPEAVPFAVSNGIGLSTPESGDVTDAVVRRIADRQMLIVVDNCEHVVDGAADIIERLAAECPRVRIVATSREPLMIRGERVVPVGPLPVDDGLALFLDRARAESPSLVLDDQQLEAAAALCRRIDGLPLAIELAAARVRSMTPVDLVAGLDERFRLLVGNRRSRTERHQTMRATLDWSYSLCTPEDQAVFDRLSVFPAQFDGPAIRAVAARDDISPLGALDAVARLVDRSLISSEVDDDGATRFRMLETMRVYGREHLRDAGGSDLTRERHARHIAERIDELTATLLGPDEERGFRRLAEFLPDALLALDWFLEHDEIDQAMRLPNGFQILNPREGFAMIERVQDRADGIDIAAPVRAEMDLATFSLDARSVYAGSEMAPLVDQIEPRSDRDVVGFTPDTRAVDTDLADAIMRLEERFRVGRPLSRYTTLFLGGRSLLFNGYTGQAARLLGQLDTLAEETDSEAMRSSVLELRAQSARISGDHAGAAALLDEVVRRRSGALELSNIAVLARFHSISMHVHAGDPIAASELRRAWDTLERHGNVNPSWRAGSATAIALTAQGHRDLGIRFLRWAARLDDVNLLLLFEDELARFDLPLEPEGPDERLAELLGELDLL